MEEQNISAVAPIMKTGMLIRKPVEEVFELFINPQFTTQIWFTKSSGRLEAGKQITWEWEMYGVSAEITVKAVEQDQQIDILWPGQDGMNTVEWKFTAMPDGTTFVEIQESGFTAQGPTLLRQVADSTEGFSFLLAGAKALLEHGVRLNLVGDRFPQSLEIT